MTHTPGLWKLSDNPQYSINTSDYPNSGKHIAMVSNYWKHLSPEESLANAHLIATAPELLEMCEEMLKICKHQCKIARAYDEFTAWIYCVAKLETVIAKAIGKGEPHVTIQEAGPS
jgi:hypothetical protein